MNDYVVGLTRSTFQKALKRFAISQSAKTSDIQLIITGNELGFPFYSLYKQYQLVKKEEKKGEQKDDGYIEFSDVLGTLIDFSGIESIAPPFLEGAIKKLSEENNIPIGKIRIMIKTDCDVTNHEDIVLSIFLYNGSNNIIKKMTLEKDIFQMEAETNT